MMYNWCQLRTLTFGNTFDSMHPCQDALEQLLSLAATKHHEDYPRSKGLDWCVNLAF